MSTQAISLDPRVELITTLAAYRKDFAEMTRYLPKKSSVEAVVLIEEVEEMLLKAAIDPNLTESDLKLMEHIPMPDDATPELANDINDKNSKIDMYNEAIREAAARKVHESDYLAIQDHLRPKRSAVNNLWSIKGRFTQLFTKRLGDGQHKGLLGALGNSDKE